MTTIRSLMLAQQARHEGWTHPATERTTCSVCDEVWPCADRVAADAVITELDAAELIHSAETLDELVLCRLVPDPWAS